MYTCLALIAAYDSDCFLMSPPFLLTLSLSFFLSSSLSFVQQMAGASHN